MSLLPGARGHPPQHPGLGRGQPRDTSASGGGESQQGKQCQLQEIDESFPDRVEKKVNFSISFFLSFLSVDQQMAGCGDNCFHINALFIYNYLFYFFFLLENRRR